VHPSPLFGPSLQANSKTSGTRKALLRAPELRKDPRFGKLVDVFLRKDAEGFWVKQSQVLIGQK
jgi:hypothetical protein